MPALPAAEIKPDLACVGSLVKIESPKLSAKGKYSMLPLTFAGARNAAGQPQAPKEVKLSLLYVPEWFAPGFNPNSLDFGTTFVYKRNIGARESVAVLQALIGSNKELNAAFDAEIAALPEFTTESIGEFIHNFMIDNRLQAKVGFIVTQRKEETGLQKIDEDGNPVFKKNGDAVPEKVRTQYYEIDSFFHPDLRSLKYHRSLEAKHTEYDPRYDRAPFKVAYSEEHLD